MKAVILAAGDNTRFRQENDKHNKLLHPILGIPLVERTIRSAKAAGILEFVIITGYQDTEVKNLLKDGGRLGVKIEYSHNQRWQGENGLSVYTARGKINDKFLLLMGDHLVGSKTLAHLRKRKLGREEVVLATDKKFTPAEAEEATKVKITKGKIISIGKELGDFNSLDTGAFLCSPYLFSVLSKTIKQKKFYLTDAMRVLAKEGKLKSYDIKDGFWADIDTHVDFYLAEKRLFKELTMPREEGPVSRCFNRRFSNFLTRFVIKTPLTPNQITFFSLLVALVSGIFLTNPSYPWILIGGILAQFASIVDGVDGEVARIKFSSSSFGAWFDTVLDRYGDTAVTAGAAIGIYKNYPSSLVILVGILALSGSILSSYSAHTFKTTFGRSFGKLVHPPFTFPSGRDVRLFIIFIGGIFNFLFPALLLIAFLTHGSIFSKLFFASRDKISREWKKPA